MIVEVALSELVVERGTVALDHLLEHPRRRHTRQIRPARRRGERQAKPDQIVGRITYNGLIEIAYLDRDFAVRIRDRSQIANMTIPADPDCRAGGRRTAFSALQPLIEFCRATPNICMRRARHLEIARLEQGGGPFVGVFGAVLRRSCLHRQNTHLSNGRLPFELIPIVPFGWFEQIAQDFVRARPMSSASRCIDKWLPSVGRGSPTLACCAVFRQAVTASRNDVT